VGQQPLLGSYLAPATSLRCFDDTGLQLPDRSVRVTQVNPGPPQGVAGGDTRGVRTGVYLRFLGERSSANALIKKDRPEVCPCGQKFVEHSRMIVH